MENPKKLTTMCTQENMTKTDETKTQHRKLNTWAIRIPPKTQHRKLNTWATETPRHQKLNTWATRIPPKTQHRKLNTWATRIPPKTQHRKLNTHSQKWWVLCSFAYLRWRRRDVCNFHMIYIDDIIHNCMCVIFWTWKWYIESSWIKWNKN